MDTGGHYLEGTISTHSLTRRLTTYTAFSRKRHSYFNSQPHKEADVFVALKHFVYGIFQLTASQGG